ncbi:hypothetical protein [Arthrobacter sp. TMS1-12-1]
MNDQSAAKARVTFWVTFLGPVAFGVVAGLVRLVFPSPSPEGSSAPPAERFSSPVVAGIMVASILQIGRWLLYGKTGDQQLERLRTLCTVTSLVVFVAIGFAALVQSMALVLFLSLALFVLVLWLLPRKKVILPENRNLGIYCICILCLLVSVGSVSMSLTTR